MPNHKLGCHVIRGVGIDAGSQWQKVSPFATVT